MLLSHEHSNFNFSFGFQHRGWIGTIGDKEIMLRRTNKGGRPMIEIRNLGHGVEIGDLTHQIKYTGWK